jgi:hypothetical protein
MPIGRVLASCWKRRVFFFDISRYLTNVKHVHKFFVNMWIRMCMTAECPAGSA